MTPAEREKIIHTLTLFISSKSEMEADEILRSAGARQTPGGWGSQGIPIKRRVVRQRLEAEDDDILEYLAELMPEDVAPNIIAEPSTLPAVETERTADGAIFVVHGHARAVLYEAVRVLERGTGQEVIILHEQANAGRTILEKFEDFATNASFVVVLLTGDDVGGIKSSSDVHPRGRQNVIFELGFFFGKLGRDRVVVLHEGDVEKPSDISGLAYISLDQAGAWKQALARELEAAGISVDRSRIP